jgi:tetratricopeptide (TPR) repeat protein
MSNSSLTIWSAIVSGLSDGGHALTFYTADYSDNIGTNNIIFTINITIPDTTLPSITINSPPNGTYYTSTSVWVNITINENASWVGYSLDNDNNVTMTNESITSWYKQMTTLSNGLHSLTFYANDTSGNMGNSSIKYFYVDTQAPTYSVYNTTPYVANQSQSVTCYVQWTDNVNLASGKVAENSSESFVNHTVDISGASGWTNYTILGNDLYVGIFGCKFYATDSAGNSNSTETSFTVQDVVNPTVTIASPSNSTYSQNWVTASITLSESGKWANYSLDGGSNVSMSNSSLTIWSATVSSLSNAQHTLVFYAADYSDNIGTNSITFAVDTTIYDTTPPIITVWSPTNGTYYTSSSVTANITLNEAGSSATYSVNRTANVSMNNFTNTNWNATVVLNNGEHNITFYANDTSTNKNTGASSTIYFTVDTSASQNTTQGPSTSNDTVNITCYSRWTDNLGLNYGYLEHNAIGTATNSSQISLSGTSGWINVTIAMSDTNPGIIQCKAYVYDKAGLVNTSTWFVNVTDATNPVVENMTYTPNTTDDLDPNVMVRITANVSDNGQLSSVVLQYKLTNESTWSIRTMNLVSGNMYTGNFTPTEGNWSFRINATDSYGNENVTDMTNISVGLDRSWTNTTNIPSVKSIVRTWSRAFSLGNLTINNTGDYDLNFTVASNRDWITLNGTNTSIEFILNQTGNSTTFNVTANTTGFAVGEYTYTITINSYTTDSILVSSQNISGTVIIQNVAGPYFDVKIITYDSSITQGQTGISLKSSVENVGTEDATGTWLAWTLPSEWSVASGIANVSVGFLGIGETVYNSITVDLSSSADTGQQTLMANASCLEGVTDSDNKTVTVSGEVTTTTVPQTVSGGGGGEIAALKTEKIEIWKTIEIVRGKEDSFNIDVVNTFKDSVLENLTLDVKGFLAQYISIEPESFSGVEYGETRNFTVKIKIPTYKGYEEYLLNATIKGKIVEKIGNATTIKNLEIKKYITLIIHEISKEEANLSLTEAEQAIKEMKERKITTMEVEKLFITMKEKLDAGEYEEAEKYSKEILSIKEIAFNAYNLINELKESIESYSVTGAVIKSSTVLRTQSLLNLAIAAFERGDFETAIERANNAKLTLALETKESDFVLFVDKLVVNMPLLIIIIGFFGIFGYKQYAKANISKKIRDLQNEEDNVRILMRKAQKQYFGRKISDTMYNSEMERLEKRLTELKKTIINLRHKRVTLLEPKEVIKSLNEENKEVIKIIKKLQEEYFNKRKITKKTYDQQIEMLNERLAEIEDERLKLEVMMRMGKK